MGIGRLETVTITEEWHWSSGTGYRFPAGTVFFMARRDKNGATLYEYASPLGDMGRILLDAGEVPGQNKSCAR